MGAAALQQRLVAEGGQAAYTAEMAERGAMGGTQSVLTRGAKPATPNFKDWLKTEAGEAVATQPGAKIMNTTYCPEPYAAYTVAQAYNQHYDLTKRGRERSRRGLVECVLGPSPKLAVH